MLAELRELKSDIYELGKSLDGNNRLALRQRDLIGRTRKPGVNQPLQARQVADSETSRQSLPCLALVNNSTGVFSRIRAWGYPG